MALLGEGVELEAALGGLENDCKLLTTYAAETRYPDDFYEPDEKEARRAHEAALTIRSAILERLPGARQLSVRPLGPPEPGPGALAFGEPRRGVVVVC